MASKATGSRWTMRPRGNQTVESEPIERTQRRRRRAPAQSEDRWSRPSRPTEWWMAIPSSCCGL